MTGYGSDNYSYNSANQRLKKTESGTTTYYLRGGLHVLAEYDGSGNLAAEYIYGIDGMVSKFDSTQGHFWFVKDHLGSTRRLDSSSMLRDYYPFGEDYTSAGSETDYMFTGKEKDGSELYYFGARYYDARVGRWLSVDPLAGKYPDLSPYNYSLNNPVVNYDPDGEAVLRAIVSGFKIAKRAFKLAKQGKSLRKWDTWKKAGIDEVYDLVDNVKTLADGNLNADDAFAVFDLVTGFGKEAKKVLKGAQNPKVKEAIEKGKKAHTDFKQKVKNKAGWKAEPRLTDPQTGKTVIPDATTPSGRPVELKPNTPSGIEKGKKQLKGQERATGKKGRVVKYDSEKIEN